MKKKSPKSKKNALPKADKKVEKIQLVEEDENQLLEILPADQSVFRSAAKQRNSETEDENLLEIPEFAFAAAPPSPQHAAETEARETVNFPPEVETRFEEIEREAKSAAEEVSETNLETRAEEEEVYSPVQSAASVTTAAADEEKEELQLEAQGEKADEIQPSAQFEDLPAREAQINEIQTNDQFEEINEIETVNQTDEISEAEPEKITEADDYQTSTAPTESIGETARKSGLAYGAALTLFGSVVIMLVLGYFADRLFGTSPWGIIIGIVLGAAIGFYQFFRITSQIFKNKS